MQGPDPASGQDLLEIIQMLSERNAEKSEIDKLYF